MGRLPEARDSRSGPLSAGSWAAGCEEKFSSMRRPSISLPTVVIVLESVGKSLWIEAEHDNEYELRITSTSASTRYPEGRRLGQSSPAIRDLRSTLMTLSP